MSIRSISRRAIFLTIILNIFLFLSAGSVFASTTAFTRTLSAGMSGNDVLQLQKILNSDPDTQVTALGAGSPGQETAYFGALTAAAVIRLQEKNASDILVPNGLSAGTGIVGPSTRAVLARLSSSSKIVTAGIPSSNPNLIGLPRFIAAVEKVSQKKGVSPQALAVIENQIYHDVATTTDLRATFLKLIQEPKVSVVLPSPVGRIYKALTDSLGGIFGTRHVSAETGGSPMIISQPNNVSSIPGNTVSFNVVALGNSPLAYQWKKNGINLVSGGNISGATTTFLVISNLRQTDAGNYTVTVSNAAGSTTSQAAVLAISSGSSEGSGGGSDDGSGSGLGQSAGSLAGIGAGIGAGALSNSNSGSNSNSSSDSSSNGQSPFGGELYYSFYCGCSGNWLLTIQPLAPNYVTLLTYTEGTQLYESYNIPFTQYLLGFYEQGQQCQVYAGTACVTISSEGEVSSTVGSSI